MTIPRIPRIFGNLSLSPLFPYHCKIRTSVDSSGEKGGETLVIKE